MSTTLPANSSMMEGRVRRSWGSLGGHTAQSQPSVGTPIDVPLPSTVSVAFKRGPACSSSAGSSGSAGLWRTRQRVGYFHISHAHFVKAVLQESLFRRGEVSLGLFGKE